MTSDLENMCKTRWHIVILQCLQDISQRNCSRSDETKFQKVVWKFTLNSERYEKAADYICNDYNIKIFENHKTSCFLKNEKDAELCSLKRKKATDARIKFLRFNHSINKQQAYHICSRDTIKIYRPSGAHRQMVVIIGVPALPIGNASIV